MADNVTVSNAPTSVNADIPVRSLDKSGEQIQVVAIDYGGAGAESLTVPDFATEATLSNINTTLSAGITVQDKTADILGVAVTGSRNNQVEISFATSFDSNLITNTNTGGGSASISNGHALYSSGTGTSATSKGVSVGSVVYRPAHEQYAYFTAAWTTPTSANSDQRIGLYDANNGYFIGFDGLTFGLTRRVAAVDTFTGRTSFNGDLLDGSASSKFTRNGTPEAINLTYSNLFRIRFAWLGSASVLFDVFSPDSAWVTFHTLKWPNTQLNPHIAVPNLPMTIEVIKASADATNLIMATACWAGGTTSDYQKITDTLTDYSLASLNRSVITGRASTGGGTYYNVKVTPSGSLTTATSIEDFTAVAGQKTMANSFPVVFASNQTAIEVDCAGSYVTISDISQVVGQQNKNASLPVTMAANQDPMAIYPAGKTITSGKITLSTAGTPVRITTSATPIYRIDVRAALANVGTIYVGGSAVTSTQGMFLQPGEAYHFDLTDLSYIYFDGSTNGDVIQYNYTAA